MTEPAKDEYELIITDSDKIALLNIINQTTFKGADVKYVSDLIDRVNEAPLRANKGHQDEGGQA